VTWGQGYGQAFGGEPLTSLDDPRSEVGEDPITFDFTDEANGPLPGAWDRFEYTVDVGSVVGTAEADPDTYYRVLDGRGFWSYVRAPAAGTPYSEQGVAASPPGVLQGRNGRIVALVDAAPPLVDAKQDELWYEVIVGLRANEQGTSYVGARLHARWLGGAWSAPLTVEAIHASGDAPVVLGTAVLPAVSALDLWGASAGHEIAAEVRGTVLTVTFDGHTQLVVDVPDQSNARPVVVMRVYRRAGLLVTAVPVLRAVQLQTLRDLDHLGAPPQIHGPVEMEAPLYGRVLLPVRELLQSRNLRQVGGRSFEFLADTLVEVNGTERQWLAGEVVHATERYVGQDFVPVEADLARIRAQGGS
jgi:hypothetical protein